MRFEPSTPSNIDLLIVANTLNYTEYEIYKSFQRRAENDLMMKKINPITQETCTVISAIQYGDAEPRIFKSSEDRCGCVDRLKNLTMCPHEIKAKKGFKAELFQPRHFMRDHVSGSLHGWEPLEDQVDNILGYEPESFTEHNDDNFTDESLFLTQELEEKVTEDSADVMTEQIPPGYLPDNTVKVKPLRVKKIENIMRSVLGSYNT